MLITEHGLPLQLSRELDLPISPPQGAAAIIVRQLAEHFATPTKAVIDTEQVREFLEDRVSPFRLQVLQAINDIPSGQTRTYGEIAAQLGSPGAVRAVGTACARNPLPLVIPCHRVLPASGLGQYSGPGGAESKRLLLEREGAL